MTKRIKENTGIRCMGLMMAVMLLFAGCSRNGLPQKELSDPGETAMLLDYFERSGNLVNDPDIPHLIGPEDVFNHLAGFNQLVIDLRPQAEFNRGHIMHAVNILPADILSYFENSIEPNAYDHIVLVCNDAMLSGYVTAVLRFLGYGNVVFMRNGLSIWDMDIAQQYWLAAMRSHMEGQLETTSHSKNAHGPLPEIRTGHQTAYDILRARAKEILLADEASVVIPAEVILQNHEDYYIVNYWPEDLYLTGHIAGSVQYEPKASFGKDQYLGTLPVDKPVVIYCFTGHHSVYPVAYLRLLGYDARHIPYGVNAFIQQTMLDTQPPRRSFLEGMVKNYPLTGPEAQDDSMQPAAEIKTETITVQGGC